MAPLFLFCSNLFLFCFKDRKLPHSGADPEILKRKGGGGILGFSWSKKAKITLETEAFGETFLLVFSNFLHFYIQWKLTNEILSVFQDLQTLLWEKRKSSHTAVIEKRRTEKSWNLFYLTDYFMKPSKMAINHFFFSRFFCSQDLFLFCKLVHSAVFVFWCQDDARNIKRGNCDQKIARNSKLQYLLQK